MTDLEMAQTDLESLEKSLAFHTARLKTWGKPRAHKWVLPFDDTDPRYVIPSLEKNIAILKADIAKMSKKTKSKKA
jgi:hypothetical protein